MSQPELKTVVNGIVFENPFLLASGPPTTNARVIAKGFDLGWGGAVTKTISLDAAKVINVSPRYAKLRSHETGEVIGFENIELISDRPFEAWLEDLRQLRKAYPHKVLIASVMEEFDRARWHEIVRLVQETGVHALELNLSCPHGMPERRMGMAMGEDPDCVAEVVAWVKEVSRIPVWAKLTPNVARISEPAEAAVKAGADGLAAINTILSVNGIDLATLRPLPTVEGLSMPGGYSGAAVRPIALRHVMEIANSLPGVAVSGMGGIDNGKDAAEFMLLGASTVQACTAVMLKGYGIIDLMKEQMTAFMQDHGFECPSDFVGHSLQYFTTWAHLVEIQRQARDARHSGVVDGDSETWKGAIAHETAQLTSNEG